MTINCARWCTSCSLVPITISNRFFPPEALRVTISAARASGKFSTPTTPAFTVVPERCQDLLPFTMALGQ
jgi:hypothetical protein